MRSSIREPLLAQNSSQNQSVRTVLGLLCLLLVLVVGLTEFSKERFATINDNEAELGGNSPPVAGAPTAAEDDMAPHFAPAFDMNPSQDVNPDDVASTLSMPQSSSPVAPAAEPAPDRPQNSPYVERYHPGHGRSPSGSTRHSLGGSPGPSMHIDSPKSSSLFSPSLFSGSPSKSAQKSGLLPGSPSKVDQQQSSQRAGSSQAGPSSASAPGLSTKMVEANSPMGKIRVDETLHSYYATDPADCNDPIVGFEKLVKPCKELKMHHIFLTPNHRTYVPMVINPEGKCMSKECMPRDRAACCIQRRKCIHFEVDIPEGCQSTQAVNPYKYAFCRSNPCTIVDADICCVGKKEIHSAQFNQRYTLVNNLQTRIDENRSKQARVAPDDNAAYVDPHISFDYGELAWINMDAKRRVGDDVWAPLVDFMASWGDGYGWGRDAWMKVKKGREEKYQTYQIGTTMPLDPSMSIRDVMISDIN